LKEHGEELEQYAAIQASDAYKETPAYRLQALLRKMNEENGYNEVFIPAMQRLSPAYRAYHAELMETDRVFAARYQGAGALPR
jgi:hypothetical protein